MDYIIGGIAAALLFAYLIYALLKTGEVLIAAGTES